MADILTNTILPVNESGVVTFVIFSEEKDITYDVELCSLEISVGINRIPRAVITFIDGSPSKQNFKISDEDWFDPGKKIKIQLGYQSDNENVFSGIVLHQSISIRSGGRHLLTVECASEAIQMTSVRKSRYFYDIEADDLFKKLTDAYSGIKTKVTGKNFTYPELLQFQVTDWDFMVDRADKLGRICVVSDSEIKIAEIEDGEPVLKAIYGKNLLDLEIKVNPEISAKAVKAEFYNLSKSKKMEKEAEPIKSLSGVTKSDNPKFESDEIFRYGGTPDDKSAQIWADAKLKKNKLAQIRGWVKLKGSSKVSPGNFIELDGIGNRFNKKVLVGSVRHSYAEGAWLMEIGIGLSENWFSNEYDISPEPLDSMGAYISGLQIGLVTKLEEDPDEDERIRINLPLVDPEEKGIWARMITPGAGNNRGVVIRPEIGDEVIVGFLHDDPNQPIILGSLNSAGKPSPIKAEKENDVKGWVTRGEMEMLVNDKEPSILIKMPSGRKIDINDKSGVISISDASGNNLAMDSNGIQMKSKKTISIEAGQKVSIKSNVIDLNAKTMLKMNSNGTGQFSAKGVNSITGQIVKIN